MKTDFFNTVLHAASSSGSLYKGTLKDRRALLFFMEKNDLLTQTGFPVNAKEDVVRLRTQWFPKPTTEKMLLSRLSLWLSAYKRSDKERLKILITYGRDLFPKTCATYEEFTSTDKGSSPTVVWQLLDYLLSVLDKEIPGMSLDETDRVLSTIKAGIPKRHLSLFIKYLDFLSQRMPGPRIAYSSPSQKKGTGDSAYSTAEFSAMAYFIFNEQYWIEHNLLSKACSSKHNANLWAYLSFFFISGLRGTDVIRIPRPSLPFEGDEYRHHILNGDIHDPGKFAREIQFRISCHAMFPSKTGKNRDVPLLKLSIPAILEEPLGIIISIAASFFPESSAGKPFLHKSGLYSAIRSFFGAPFADLLDYKNFKVVRANKAYLQGIEMLSDKIYGSGSHGYILAALARSHKGNLGSLPKTTDIYLKDAAFSGMDPDFVLFQMFQRGIFGFIPHLLLETCFGSRYHHLNIRSQTDLIRQIEIAPSGIESLVRSGETALAQARAVIHDLIARNADMRSTLLRIASGEATAKQENFLCAVTAAGFACAFPERRGCIGCTYEICTKAALHNLVTEFERLQSCSSAAEGWREREIARTAVLPIIREFFFTIRLLYPEADLSPYHCILEGGIDHYDPYIISDS